MIENKNIVIGIEGMVGAGKTDICRELTNLIPNSIFIDGAEIYRGIVEAYIKNGLKIEELKQHNIDPLDLMKKLNVEFKIEDRCTQIYRDGKKVSKEETGKAQNSMAVSKMAANSNNEGLYKFARNILDEYRKKFNIILSARDLVIMYPDMNCHVFITADFSERVNRRYNQYNGKYTKKEVEDMIRQRDELHEKSGFNKLYEKSIKIDITECKDKMESSQKVLSEINKFLGEY